MYAHAEDLSNIFGYKTRNFGIFFEEKPYLITKLHKADYRFMAISKGKNLRLIAK